MSSAQFVVHKINVLRLLHRINHFYTIAYALQFRSTIETELYKKRKEYVDAQRGGPGIWTGLVGAEQKNGQNQTEKVIT
jgi:hypothetical protein